jgi:DNA-binding winged helix-turn-helix (wHTH) protein/tetratricopeptide (TPR) repeat protein
MNARDEIRFDGWTLHRATGELTRGAQRVRLQAQPQQVLEALLATPGELVPREQLIARLWPRGVVDFDLSLNSAVRRLRLALGDDADSPRYIETIPRRGYRYVGPVEPSATVLAPHARWWQAAAVLLLVAGSVAAGSLVRIDSGARELAPAVAKLDVQAEEHFVRADHFMHRRQPGDLDRARQYLLDALAIDPRFARAWAGLASVYWLATVEGQVPPEQGLQQVREAALRALALDPQLVEAHLRLANYLCRTGRTREAQEHLAEASRLEPDNPLVLGMTAGMAAAEGRLDRAIALQQRAVQADPLSLAVRGNLVAYLLLAERLDEARVEIVRLRELDADAPRLDSYQARLLMMDGRFEEALELAATMPDGAERRLAEAIAHYRIGNSVEAEAALRALIDMPSPEVPVLQIAEVFAARGEPDQALAWLLRVPARSGHDPSIEFSPFLRTLHSDPRWNEWLAMSRRPTSAPSNADATSEG